MHLHNGLTHATDLQSAYAAAVGEKSDAEFTGIERAGETLTPVIDLWSLPEWQYLRRVRAMQLRATEAAGAGRSRLAIRNPIGSKNLVTVQWIQNANALASIALTLGTGLTVDSSENLRPVDTRWYTPSTGAGVAMVDHRQGAIGGTSTALGGMSAPQGQLLQLDFILQPGWSLSFDPSADATAISLCFRVRERPALPGEL